MRAATGRGWAWSDRPPGGAVGRCPALPPGEAGLLGNVGNVPPLRIGAHRPQPLSAFFCQRPSSSLQYCEAIPAPVSAFHWPRA